MELNSTRDWHLPLVVLAAMAGAGLIGAAFYGWMNFGSAMLLTLAENGLSGCF